MASRGQSRGNVWKQSAGSRITTCWNVPTPHPPTLTQKQTHLSGSTRYKAPDAYVQLCFIENGWPNRSIEHLYGVHVFKLNVYCIVVCRVNGLHCVCNWKGRINVSRPSGKNIVLHSAAKDINSREAEWWSPTCGPNPDSLNPVPSHVSGHSKKKIDIYGLKQYQHNDVIMQP